MGFFGCLFDAAQAQQTALFLKRSTCYDPESVYFVALLSPRQVLTTVWTIYAQRLHLQR